MVTAPMIPPVSELSLPIIAFCSTLLIRSRTTRSKALSWPSCRLPQRRKATSRNAYTTPARSTFSTMADVGDQDVHEAPAFSIAPVATDRGRI